MGLFSKPKKEIITPTGKRIASLPEFPAMPEEGNTELPSYESTLDAIKKEVGGDFDLPARETQKEKKLPSADLDFHQTPVSHEEKPVFIRIDNYKEAMSQLNDVKKRLAQAEEMINQLEHIKAEEDAKLESWRKDIQAIKDRLLSIDKNLFEA